MNVDELKDRIAILESAIRYHAEQRGDDRCFLDDLKLYKLIGIDEHPGLNLPKEEFLSGCSKFWECQQTGEEYKKPESKPVQSRDWSTPEWTTIIDKHGVASQWDRMPPPHTNYYEHKISLFLKLSKLGSSWWYCNNRAYALAISLSLPTEGFHFRRRKDIDDQFRYGIDHPCLEKHALFIAMNDSDTSESTKI